MDADTNDPMSEDWGWKESNGLTPPEQVPEVVRLEKLRAYKRQRNDTITYLKLLIPSRDRLQQALDATKFGLFAFFRLIPVPKSNYHPISHRASKKTEPYYALFGTVQISTKT
jgi:hypothetical protein